MKKQLLLLIITILPMVLSAQRQKGVKVLEGNVSYYLSNSEDFDLYSLETDKYKSQQFSISPKIGWFISESSVLGVGLGYNFTKYESLSESKVNLFSISPYYRNYKKITEKLFYTTSVELALGYGKESSSQEATIVTYGFNVRPGLSYFLSDKWTLKANFGSLYYQETTRKITEGVDNMEPKLKDTDFGFNLNMESFSLGIGYYF